MSATVEEPTPATLTFRCPGELEGWLPEPTAASAGLPDWFRTMPGQAFNAIIAAEDDTLKRCPPFVDAMSSGYLMPLICDVTVENGQLTWDIDLPPSELAPFPRSPLGIHDPSQAAGAPFFDADQFLIKFHNLWTIEAPEGYAVLFTHPFNRFDLPFTTLTGLVDCDLYHHAWVHFPAVWRDPTFNGVLRKGTPIAQCIPVRRESWTARTTAMSADEARRAHAVIETMEREKGVYRRRFRA
jgi:hypothetical protein